MTEQNARDPYRSAHAAMDMMAEEVHQFIRAKGWDDDKTFGDCMALLHSEVSEALEAYRDHGIHDATEEVGPDEIPKPEGVGSEFADVFIRLLDDCLRYNIDLFREFRRKMDYNWTRSFRHGGKRL